MSVGVAWALVAALGFGVTQTLNRKANLTIGAYRTAFGLLMTVELILIARMLIIGELALLGSAPLSALALFTGSATIHYVAGWSLLALSQGQIGVARTGAVTSAAPLVATILAAVFLGESLTVSTVGGVVLSMTGVAMVSMSRGTDGRAWTIPWFGLAVALCWGSSPMLIRKGLEGLDAPVLGLTVGLGAALVVGAFGLASIGGFERSGWSRSAIRWAVLGGVTGALGISAQWISYGLVEVAVAITVQQLATIVVLVLAPFMFDSRFERPTLLLVSGTAAMLAGSVIVVWANNA
jgi:drug/metabolite transporter (DMT)-like permease